MVVGPKTVETDANVEEFLQNVENTRRRADSLVLLDLFRDVTGVPPRMWGDSIVGFGAYDYTYDSGHSGRWFLTGFAPRKAAMTIHIMPGTKRYADMLANLGPHRTAASCLYITRLDRIDLGLLRQVVAKSVDDMRAMYDV